MISKPTKKSLPPVSKALLIDKCVDVDEDVDMEFFHCTPAKNVASILKQGLKPGHGRNFNTEGWSTNKIFLSLGYKEAVQWQGMIAEQLLEETAILRVFLSDLQLKNLNIDEIAYGDGNECSFFLTETIPAAQIEVYDTGAGSLDHVVMDETKIYNVGLQVFIESLVNQILLEGKIDDEIKKFQELGNMDMVEYLKYFKNNSMHPKYLPWVVKQGLHNKDEVSIKEPQKIFSSITAFDSLVAANIITGAAKDVNRYKSLGELEELVNDYQQKHAAKQKEKETVKKGTKKIFEDEVYLLVEPKNEASSCSYGKGTRWCISATFGKNHFNEYSKSGARFIFIINKNTNDKDAIAFISDGQVEIFNAADEGKPPDYINGKYPRHVKEELNKYIGKNVFSPESLDDVLKFPEKIKKEDGKWFESFLDSNSIINTWQATKQILNLYDNGLSHLRKEPEHWVEVNYVFLNNLNKILSNKLYEYYELGYNTEDQYEVRRYLLMYLELLKEKNIKVENHHTEKLFMLYMKCNKPPVTKVHMTPGSWSMFLPLIFIPSITHHIQSYIEGHIALEDLTATIVEKVRNAAEIPGEIRTEVADYWKRIPHYNDTPKSIAKWSETFKEIKNVFDRANWDLNQV